MPGTTGPTWRSSAGTEPPSATRSGIPMAAIMAKEKTAMNSPQIADARTLADRTSRRRGWASNVEVSTRCRYSVVMHRTPTTGAHEPPEPLGRRRGGEPHDVVVADDERRRAPETREQDGDTDAHPGTGGGAELEELRSDEAGQRCHRAAISTGAPCAVIDVVSSRNRPSRSWLTWTSS